MLTCIRLLELEYHAVIFSGDDDCGPSYRKIAPTTARTVKTTPPRLDHTRKRVATDPSSVGLHPQAVKTT
jgi:hypothetical protein